MACAFKPCKKTKPLIDPPQKKKKKKRKKEEKKREHKMKSVLLDEGFHYTFKSLHLLMYLLYIYVFTIKHNCSLKRKFDVINMHC